LGYLLQPTVRCLGQPNIAFLEVASGEKAKAGNDGTCHLLSPRVLGVDITNQRQGETPRSNVGEQTSSSRVPLVEHRLSRRWVIVMARRGDRAKERKLVNTVMPSLAPLSAKTVPILLATFDAATVGVAVCSQMVTGGLVEHDLETREGPK
jgi:hypothetical protein